MANVPDFDEALRRQREVFAARYAANPALAETAREVDAMYMHDEAEPVKDYASRRGE